VHVEIADLEMEAVMNIEAKDAQGNIYHTKIYLASLNCPLDTYQASSDLSSVDKLDIQMMQQLIEAYQNLPETLWYKGDEGEYRWQDYGQVYAEVNKLVLALSK
jgi:hypothetical protein